MDWRWSGACRVLLQVLAFFVFSGNARCQTELPSAAIPANAASPVPATVHFDFTAANFHNPNFRDVSLVTFERIHETDENVEDWLEQGTPQTVSPSPVVHSSNEGLVKRSVKRTLQDQKELYLTPFKPSNFKWDAVVLGGTGALIATDRRIEVHIGKQHEQAYQNVSDIAIGGLSGAAAGIFIYSFTGNHPHARETGMLELETLVNTFLIYTPMQLLAARQRPDEGNGYGDFWKHHNINTSFPGGHAMFTFAMATVISHEYKEKWVQVLAYTAASLVTVTRFKARDHWASDMFIGPALGIGIGSHIFHAHCDPDLSDSCKHHVRWIF